MVVAWRVILRTSEMINGVDGEGCVNNIFKEPLAYDLIGFTQNVVDKMQFFFGNGSSWPSNQEKYV